MNAEFAGVVRYHLCAAGAGDRVERFRGGASLRGSWFEFELLSTRAARGNPE